MTNKTEAIEKIAEYLAVIDGTFDSRLNWKADCNYKQYKRNAMGILDIMKSLGYVQKAEDQSLPDIRYYEDEKLDPKWIQEATQQDMLNAGWVKVKKE